MAQAPISTDGPEPAPLIYTVPGQHPVTPLSIYAEFDGAAASNDFIPALVIRSQSGYVLAFIPADQTVVIGDYVEATWAPFLRGDTSGGATAGSIAALGQMWFSNGLFADPAVSIPAGGNTNVSFAHTFTSDASLVSFSSVANTNDTLLLNSTGHLYLILGAAYWQLAGFVQQTILSTQAATIVGGELLGNISGHAIHPADYFNIVQPLVGVTQGPIDYMAVIPQSAGQAVTLNALHNSGTAKSLIQAFVACIAWKLP